MRAANLFNRTFDGILNQPFMALLAGELVIDLRDDLAFGIIAIGIHRADRADPARRRPCARTGVIRRRNAFAAFNQRPDFAASVNNWLQTLERHYYSLSQR